MNDDTLHAALRASLRAAESPWARLPLQTLSDTGLAHWHVRLVGSGLVARMPKQSQVGLPVAEHLAYEAACFERAAPSGHTPRLHAVLPPVPELPRGALLVDEVVGRPARLPADLGAIARALAALHRLPLPARAAPLLAPIDPLAALFDEIQRQAAYLPAARLQLTTQRTIQNELRQLQLLGELPERPRRRLISFDGHPGNYLVAADGRAWLVDLEKARYGPAALDLAHATLYTSTTWDTKSHAVLTPQALLAFHHSWAEAVGPVLAEPRWIVPLRRAMWLWSITWCAKWRVLSEQPPAGSGGEDWSAALSDPPLVQHVRQRVDHYLSPEIVERVCSEADQLALALG